MKRAQLLAVGALLIAAEPCSAGRLCLSGELGFGDPVLYPCEPAGPGGSLAWIGFSDETEHPNTWCTSCACALPEFCPCCPWDDTGSLCDANDHAAVWTVSSSATDPLVIDGELPEDGWLYLWIAERETEGLCWAYFTFSGSLTAFAFEPSEGIDVDVDDQANWLLHVPAELVAPFLVGRVLVQEPSPVERRSWGRTKALYRE